MDSACVFCDRKNFEERLIYENGDFYVVPTLGQITDGGYILTIPKRHVSCLAALSVHPQSTELDNFLELVFNVSRALSSEYSQKDYSGRPFPVTFFEHGIVGQTIKHAHLHILPSVLDFTHKVLADFPKSKFEYLEYPVHLQVLYKNNPQPYLFWSTPKGKKMVCWDPPAPPQYLRLIAAELLGRPERGNWRNVNSEDDKKLCDETVRRLKPYFSKYYL